MQISDEVGSIDRVIEAARDKRPVGGLTHNFYRYPARFSPVFVRSVIEAYSGMGDWVFDPFAGGGTTLVEAMALGRNVLGVDISSLSAFICKAKTTILNDREIASFERWRLTIEETINMRTPGKRFESYADSGYYRNLENSEFWRLRKAIEQCLMSVERLVLPGSSVLARCTVLRAAQWALDGRKKRPTVSEFRAYLSNTAEEMINGAKLFREEIKNLPKRPRRISLNRSVAGIDAVSAVRKIAPPKLIVTSPPYPGVRVLYHRWQVYGRREASAPFWISGKLDGAGISHYTMGYKSGPELRSYFEQLESSFQSIAEIANSDTTIVQMVSFSEPDWQLPRYLEVMERCGLREEQPWSIEADDGRLWRDVPNRKWYANYRNKMSSSREVVLVHRKAL